MIKNFKYRLNVIKKLLPYTGALKKYIFITALLSLITMAVNLFQPQLYKVFIDNVVLGGNYYQFKYVVIGYLLVFFVTVLIEFINYKIGVKFGNDFLFRVKEKILNKFLKIPHSQYETLDIGETKMKLEDDPIQLTQFLDRQSIGLCISYLSLVLYTGVLLMIEWRLAIFSLVLIPITIILDNFLSKYEKKLNNQNRDNDRSMSGWMHESMQGWREIKALCLGKTQEKIYTKYLYNYAVYYGKWINYWTARVLVIPKIRDLLFMQFGLYFFGGLLIINNELEIGELLVFMLYYENLSASIKTISSCDAELIASMPYVDRVLVELKEEPQEVYNPNIEIKKLKKIKLTNVAFSYGETEPTILKNVNFCAESGDRIAIVGSSGCGKTTLLKIITGLVKPSSGNVYYNDYDLNEFSIDCLHNKIGIVMQDTTLFNCSIRDNLLYGKDSATEEEMVEACTKAHIWDFVKDQPLKLDTVVGENGIKLSAGQRQRVVLARLFLNSPDVYFFDEATSNLDAYSENFIHDALRSIDDQKIVFIISHRKSAWELCNKIYSVEEECFR